MLTPDDITYALENTHVILAPQARLSTFGTSLLSYYLVTEDMDTANLARVREGQIHAERPQLLSPAYFAKLMLEGFGEKAEAYAEALSEHAHQFAFLKYGFRLRKNDIRSYDVHDSLDVVAARVKEQVAEKNDPLTAVLTGIDAGWEVCLIKFMVDVVQGSSAGNFDDLRERGLL